MRVVKLVHRLMAAVALVAAPSSRRQTVGAATCCKSTSAEMDANKKVAIEFFRPGADRVALADPTYKQHNPAFVKGGRDAGLSDYEYSSRFGGPPRQVAPAGRGQAEPQPPASNPLEVDGRVRRRHGHPQEFRQIRPPRPALGSRCSRSTLSARNGKLIEHWDGAVINPPAPAAEATNVYQRLAVVGWAHHVV
jgi:predicted SnoaL-like aldol condensation-catalyzing enzyme